MNAPTNATVKRDAAKRDVQAKYWSLYANLKMDMQAELDEIDRQYRAGAFDRKEAA